VLLCGDETNILKLKVENISQVIIYSRFGTKEAVILKEEEEEEGEGEGEGELGEVRVLALKRPGN
jgi:hypothetical protein